MTRLENDEDFKDKGKLANKKEELAKKGIVIIIS